MEVVKIYITAGFFRCVVEQPDSATHEMMQGVSQFQRFTDRLPGSSVIRVVEENGICIVSEIELHLEPDAISFPGCSLDDLLVAFFTTDAHRHLTLSIIENVNTDGTVEMLQGNQS